MINSTSIDFERELLQELEKFDSIFANPEEKEPSTQKSHPNSLSRKQRGTLSAYEIAVAESEKEELQDKLQTLLSRTEEFDLQLRQLHAENSSLKNSNELLRRENASLKLLLTENQLQLSHQKENADTHGSDVEDFRLLEFKLAETRSRLARAQQLSEDMYIAKEQALRDLEQERLIRIHVEKERDAYSTAYEASLQHFERWSTAKQSQAKTALLSNK